MFGGGQLISVLISTSLKVSKSLFGEEGGCLAPFNLYRPCDRQWRYGHLSVTFTDYRRKVEGRKKKTLSLLTYVILL